MTSVVTAGQVPTTQSTVLSGSAGSTGTTQSLSSQSTTTTSTINTSDLTLQPTSKLPHGHFSLTSLFSSIMLVDRASNSFKRYIFI